MQRTVRLPTCSSLDHMCLDNGYGWGSNHDGLKIRDPTGIFYMNPQDFCIILGRSNSLQKWQVWDIWYTLASRNTKPNLILFRKIK